MEVDPGSQAWDAGLRIGHKLLTINGTKISSPEQVAALTSEESVLSVTVQDLHGRVFDLQFKSKQK